MRRSSFPNLLLLLLLPAAVVYSQQEKTPASDFPRRLQSLASPWLDVTYYRLDLHIDAPSQNVAGAVTIEGVIRMDLPAELILDLSDGMRVDSATVQGRTAAVTRQPNALSIALDSAWRAGDRLTAVVYYAGNPARTGFGSFAFDQHPGGPWIWSLSEPYGAREWWPCKDMPLDKADSVDVVVTTDAALTVGSNGRLAGRTLNGDGTATTHWHGSYPISTYLVSVAIADFDISSDWYRYSPADSMEVLNYLLPEDAAAVRPVVALAVPGLTLFSRLFGQYPFLREKYGHSEFNSPGMEHQTMTSIGTFDEETVIHELAHQWFGDMITCASWSEIWLNEGFATYCTALWFERTSGAAKFADYMRVQLQRATAASGPVVPADTTSVRNLFSGSRTYAKGAAVLHMLRHVIGDSAFFRSMAAYAADTSLRYATATTSDFRRNCEATSGRDLGWFFDEWLYGDGYPHYTYTWRTRDTAGGPVVTLDIRQSTGTATLFSMPVDIELTGEGRDTIVTVTVDAPAGRFTVRPGFKPSTVRLDPGNWILKSAVEEGALPDAYVLEQNFPNPFNGKTVIRYALPGRAIVDLALFNTYGERIATLASGVQFIGEHEVSWDGAGFPSGVYFCRLSANGVTSARKIVLVR